jgi:hypothetical protein
MLDMLRENLAAPKAIEELINNNRTILVSLASIFSSIFLIIIITSFVIDPYIKETDWGTNLFEFYENNKDNNKIYIIGDSLSQCGIDPIILENYLQKQNQSYSVYSLYQEGDLPKVRIVELSHIIMSKPKIVILCPQYRWFDESRKNEDYPRLEKRYALVADKIMLDPYTKSLFSKEELDLIQRDQLHLIAYKRPLLIPGLKAKLSKVQPHYSLDTKTQLWVDQNYSVAKAITAPKVEMIKAKKQEMAFLHIVEVLESHGITVIVITMPYHPDYLRTFNNESLNNYYNIINKLNCTHYDLISFSPKINFRDYGHANYYGRQNLTKKMADILLTEARNVSQ